MEFRRHLTLTAVVLELAAQRYISADAARGAIK